MNERLNQFLRRNLENNKRAKVPKHKSGDVRAKRIVLENQDFKKNNGAYGNANSSAGFNKGKVDADFRNSKMLNMYCSDNIKHSHRPNKLKWNIKKYQSTALMKNRFNRMRMHRNEVEKDDRATTHHAFSKMSDPMYTQCMNNWITNAKVDFAKKKPTNSERRPFTDVQEFRKYDSAQRRTYASHSQERSYHENKNCSKLFRKAGAGRFSQSSTGFKEEIQYGQLYSWGSSKDGVLGHEYTEDKSDSGLKIDTNGYLVCKSPKLVDYFTSLSIKIAKMSCGAGHIIVSADNLKVYSWGCNRLGQLGLNMKEESVTTPHEIIDLRCKAVTDVY